VGTVCGRGRGTKINVTNTHINNTCDMYKSSLRHIHDPVLSSLKMKGIRLLFFSSMFRSVIVLLTYLLHGAESFLGS
jgi:hypothetical protein